MIQGQVVHLVEERALLHRAVLKVAVHIVEQVVVGELLFGGMKIDLAILK